MNEKSFRIPFYVLNIVPIMAVLAMFAGTAYAWTGPTQAPPNGNVSAPINTSSGGQVKAGDFATQGKLGVGTISPTQPLDVAGNVTASLYYDRDNTTYYVDPYNTSRYGAYLNAPLAVYPNSAFAGWWGGDIRSAGANGLYVSNSSGYYNMLAYNAYGMYTNGAVVAYPANSGYWAGDFRASGSYGMYVSNASGYYDYIAYSSYGLLTNGAVYAPSFVYSSDKRLKENIKPLEGALEMVDKLQGVRFTWKPGNPRSGTDIGLIAQDVELVVPEAVMTDPDTGLKAVDYPRLVPILLNAIKEQQKEIDELKVEVEALKVR